MVGQSKSPSGFGLIAIALFYRVREQFTAEGVYLVPKAARSVEQRVGAGKSKITRRNLVVRLAIDGALDHLLQLANVAWERITVQLGNRGFRETLAAEGWNLAFELIRKMMSQNRNISFSLAQRRAKANG